MRVELILKLKRRKRRRKSKIAGMPLRKNAPPLALTGNSLLLVSTLEALKANKTELALSRRCMEYYFANLLSPQL